ncbi:hypothetical protein T08_16363 [Trichinella sp. T8]|nr:hypothetical protein T08_16363 [Trichinella sp. T8]
MISKCNRSGCLIWNVEHLFGYDEEKLTLVNGSERKIEKIEFFWKPEIFSENRQANQKSVSMLTFSNHHSQF